MAAQAFVYREHTLGLLTGDNTLDVLHASVLRGAVGTTPSDPIHVDKKDLRPASKQDFIDYRVQWHPDYQVVDD